MKNQLDTGLNIRREDLDIVELDMLQLIEEERKKLQVEETKKLERKMKNGGFR